MLDINKVRQDTPGCHDKLFFNSAGSSLPPKPVTESMIAYLKEEEQIGGYLLAAQKEAEIKAAYHAKLREFPAHTRHPLLERFIGSAGSL